MSSLTQYSQKKAIDHLLGIASWTMPTAYFCLSISDPGEAGSMSGEPPASANYGRQELTSKIGAVTLGTGIATLTSLLLFGVPSSAWGTVTHGFVTDSVTVAGGNMLLYDEIDPALAMVASASPAQFQGSDITVSILDGNLTNYARKAILDHLLGKTAFTKPTAVYLALFTASPTASGSLVNEVSGGSYARVEATSKFDAATLATGIATSNAAMTFPSPTAAWGTISYIGLADASSAGNLLWYAPLRHAFVVNNGDTAPSIPAGNLAVRMM